MSYHAYASTTCWHVTGDWNPMIIASECHRVCPPMTYQLYAHVTHTSCDGAQLCAVRRNRFWPRSRQCCTSETSASARMMPTKPNWRGAWPTSPWRMSPSCSRCGILQYAVCMTCFLHACCTRHALQVDEAGWHARCCIRTRSSRRPRNWHIRRTLTPGHPLLPVSMPGQWAGFRSIASELPRTYHAAACNLMRCELCDVQYATHSERHRDALPTGTAVSSSFAPHHLNRGTASTAGCRRNTHM